MENPSDDSGLTAGWSCAFAQDQPAVSSGHLAYQLIARGCAGRILAVVSDAVYLQTKDDEILWLARDGVPMHRRGIICSYDENALRVGISFQARAATLQIGDRLTFDLRDARLWEPRPVPASFVASREVVRARIAALKIAPTPRPLSYEERGALLSPLLVGEGSGVRFSSAVLPTGGLRLQGGSAPWPGRRQGRLAPPIAAIAEQSKALIGLGAGLTPEGDDFVGGLLFTLHHLRQAYALTWDSRPIDDLLGWARAQTNIISHTILRDLAAGHGPAPLHDLLSALLATTAGDDVAECAARLTHIGSSTGVAMLAGALTGIQLIADSET